MCTFEKELLNLSSFMLVLCTNVKKLMSHTVKRWYTTTLAFGIHCYLNATPRTETHEEKLSGYTWHAEESMTRYFTAIDMVVRRIRTKFRRGRHSIYKVWHVALCSNIQPQSYSNISMPWQWTFWATKQIFTFRSVFGISKHLCKWVSIIVTECYSVEVKHSRNVSDSLCIFPVSWY